MTNKKSNIIVTFDGKHLSYEQDGQLVKIPALSGKPGYQNPNKNQDDKDYGLLPSGTYKVKQSEYQEMDSRIVDNVLGIFDRGEWPGTESAWGTERVWLEQEEGTETYGRSGFSIHGGWEAGSAGSDNGGDTAANIYTITETCKINNINLQKYLAKVFDVIQSYKVKDIANLLPWNINLD